MVLAKESITVRTFDSIRTRKARALQIWQILIGLAHNRQTITYKILSKLLDYKGAGVFAQLLDTIMRYCKQNQLPPLTILVVNENTGSPKVIIMPNAASSPLSSAVRAGDFIFVSGTGGVVDKDGRELKGIKAQTKQTLENMKQVLEAAGSSLRDVVKVNVFITNAYDFAQMNEIYIGYFTKDRPARSTVVPGLLFPDQLIEAECVAYKPQVTP